jgi:hypothetical protein
LQRAGNPDWPPGLLSGNEGDSARLSDAQGLALPMAELFKQQRKFRDDEGINAFERIQRQINNGESERLC